MTGLLLLCAVVALTLLAGLAHRHRDGRLRDRRSAPRRRPFPPARAAAPASTSAATDPSSAAAATAADGRGRPDPADLRAVLAELGSPPGSRATLLQFSSAFCAPCRSTRRILAEVSAMVDGVTHVEIDAERHLDLVRRLRVHKTPTTLVLDASVREVKRASGQPRKADVLAALGHALR